MKIGFIGLGKMGSRMVHKLQKEGHEIVAWNRSDHELKNIDSIEKLVKSLEKPRVIWVMLPAGEVTEEALKEVSKFVEEGDVVIDGGNAFYKDTERHFEEFRKMKIRFLGIGVSGGIIASTEGYPMMAGGDKSAYENIKPILDSLSKPNGGYEYFGEGGAGHFVKMVHNGIEYGIMQSIGEGFGVLEKSPYKLDLKKVAQLYQKGTLVSGFMMERTIEVLEKDPELSQITGIIGKASGETIWTVDYAKENNLPLEIINRSLEIRNESEKDEKIQKSFAARMVAALRNAFGGHPIRQAQGKQVKKS